MDRTYTYTYAYSYIYIAPGRSTYLVYSVYNLGPGSDLSLIPI